MKNEQQMRETMTLAGMIMDRLRPKLEQGKLGDGVRISAEDCEDLISLLSVSVTIETLFDTFKLLLDNRLICLKVGGEDVNKENRSTDPRIGI